MPTTTTWTFTSDFEGWDFSDDSEGNLSASRSHSAGQIDCNLVGPGPQSNDQSRANNISPLSLNIPIVNGDTIAMDHSAPSDGKAFTRNITATFTDTTTQLVSDSGNTTAGTKTLTFSSGAKTLDKIECIFVRTGDTGSRSPFDITISLEEVRLTTASAPPEPIGGTGEKPMEIDLDLDTGAKRWVTFWDAGTITLQEYSSALAVQNTFTFTTGTVVSSIVSREYYMSPYAPPFFGTASLNDIIYVYGRWDDAGTVRHLQKSVNGGSSFSDIGDSATWGDGWVGGFFADDANTLYAFVNGASRALYRSTNAGSSWTSLSSLPFDVDPGGVSKHPDGRILISNRDAGAQTAAYAETPDYSSWIDATGSPSFPVATPGAGSNSIIWIT